MCDYCDDFFEPKMEGFCCCDSKDSEGVMKGGFNGLRRWEISGYICVDKVDGKPVLVFGVATGEYYPCYTGISFCPFCGRELKEEQ